MGESVSVVIQVPQRLVRDGLRAWFETHASVGVLRGAVETPAELVDLCDAEEPDVAILNLEADSQRSAAIEVAATLLGRHERLQLVGLQERPDVELAVRARAAGFVSTLTYDDPLEWLTHAITPHGEDTVVQQRRQTRNATSQLTTRELQILNLLGSGLTSHEIAERLGNSRRTVEHHKQHLFAKLGVQTQTQAVVFGLQRGLLTTLD